MPLQKVTRRDGTEVELFVADNSSIYPLSCPIDGTPLVRTPDLVGSESYYSCQTCSANYFSRHSGINEEQLKTQAEIYITRVKEDLEKAKDETIRLEGILKISEDNNFNLVE